MLMATATALLLAASQSACPLPPLRTGPLPWKPGEKLSYDVDVMGVVKAGTVTLAAERSVLGQIPVQARVRNTSVFAKIRKLTGTALSWLDQKTLRPARYRDEIIDRGVRKLTDARLSSKTPQISLELQQDQEKYVATFDREGEVIDLLALVYYLRAADLRRGDAICFDLVANRRYWRFRGTIAPKLEQVESAVGIFDTFRLDATITRADEATAKRTFRVWISTDARHLPVAAVSEIDMGPVRAMLSRVER